MGAKLQLQLQLRLLWGVLGALALVAFCQAAGAAEAQDVPTASQFEAELLHDQASPVGGNPVGAVTVVEFFDYRCPYCRIMEPRLKTLLRQDKDVRLVWKDWPIFGGVSIYAAQVAIAAAWQGKYQAVHDALFSLPRAMDRAAVLAVARTAAVDMTRLDSDLSERAAEIAAILDRTDGEARLLRFQGTPGFVIGHALVPGALSADDLEKLVGQAKAGQ